jgi:hypothetical protein
MTGVRLLPPARHCEDAAIQFHPLTISRRIDILTTRKAKPLDCRVGFASSQ